MTSTYLIIDYLRTCIRVREDRKRLRFWSWVTGIYIVLWIALIVYGGK
jgi:hypothetical protein